VNRFPVLIGHSDIGLHGFIADAADWRLGDKIQDFWHWAPSENESSDRTTDRGARARAERCVTDSSSLPSSGAKLLRAYLRHAMVECIGVPTRALKLLKGHSKGKRLRGLGKSLDPKEQATLVIGGLINNIQEGTDSAIQSLKALGNTRNLGMFQQDIQTGVIILGKGPRLPGMTAEESNHAMLNGEEEHDRTD
jgi:hypothetical protein